MTLPPEIQILTINATALLIAWLGLYPTMRPRTLGRVMLADAVVTGLTLVACAALFGDRGVSFWTPLGPMGWFGFWLLTYLAIEAALFALRFRDLDLT